MRILILEVVRVQPIDQNAIPKAMPREKSATLRAFHAHDTGFCLSLKTLYVTILSQSDGLESEWKMLKLIAYLQKFALRLSMNLALLVFEFCILNNISSNDCNPRPGTWGYNCFV